MIVGSVRNDAPRIVLTVAGEAGQQQIEFIVDTGYTGDLMMPLSLLQSLGARVRGRDLTILADGTERVSPMCIVQVEGDNGTRLRQAVSLDGDPLVGMAFLRDYLLTVEVIDGGEVVIEPL